MKERLFIAVVLAVCACFFAGTVMVSCGMVAGVYVYFAGFMMMPVIIFGADKCL